MAFTLLATGILVQRLPRSAAGSGSNNEQGAAFVIRNEIRKMQQTLDDKGYYGGKVDGIFGLMTRDSIRAYQKAHDLPITGEVDARTADGLGVRPELSWVHSEITARELERGGDRADIEVKRDKPSAGIARTEAASNKTSRKKVSRVSAIEDNRGDGQL